MAEVEAEHDAALAENDDEEETKASLADLPMVQSTEPIERIERRIELEKERSPAIIETDEIFRKLKMPVKGYERLKTTKKYDKAQIFGLNHPITGHTVGRHRGNPVFDVLVGERVLAQPKSLVHCEHNFDISSLKGNYKKNLDAEQKKQLRAFQVQQGHLVITNYRVLFIGQNRGDTSFDVLMQGQPKAVSEFFNLPIGLILRIEKQVHVPVEAAQKSAKALTS